MKEKEVANIMKHNCKGPTLINYWVGLIYSVHQYLFILTKAIIIKTSITFYEKLTVLICRVYMIYPSLSTILGAVVIIISPILKLRKQVIQVGEGWDGSRTRINAGTLLRI